MDDFERTPAGNLTDEGIRQYLVAKFNRVTKIKDQRIKELETENDKFEGALLCIDTWAKAYPLDVFPKPDLKQAAKVLKAAGMTLDAISADAMRHVIDGVKDITKQALKGGK